MNQGKKAQLATLCEGLDRDAAQRVIDAVARPRSHRAGERWSMAGAVLRSLKFRLRTTSREDPGLVEPNTERERALAMAMREEGLSYRHRVIVAGRTADFWVGGSRGISMAVLVTDKGRAGADAMRKRGVMTFELTDRALAEGPLKCAQKIAAILNSEVQDEDLSDDKWGMETL